MTDEQFIYELTKPVSKDCLLPYLEHDERIRELSKEPQFRDWLMKHTEAGYSCTDEWFLYNAESKLEHELGSRISWFSGLGAGEEIEVSSGCYPIYATAFEYEGNTYWVVTCFGQGSISWVMTDCAFKQEYEEELSNEGKD